jgi:hypothetical protein
VRPARLPFTEQVDPNNPLLQGIRDKLSMMQKSKQDLENKLYSLEGQNSSGYPRATFLTPINLK